MRSLHCRLLLNLPDLIISIRVFRHLPRAFLNTLESKYVHCLFHFVMLRTPGSSSKVYTLYHISVAMFTDRVGGGGDLTAMSFMWRICPKYVVPGFALRGELRRYVGQKLCGCHEAMFGTNEGWDGSKCTSGCHEAMFGKNQRWDGSKCTSSQHRTTYSWTLFFM